MLDSDEFISHPLIKEKMVKRREYQETIFINCLNHNTLVVIPTGLGKTIIALMLAVHRLATEPGSKVIFLAPTKPLVNQHYNSFVELSEIRSKDLKSITGEISPDDRKEEWETAKVAFMTPQVLQNDIIAGTYSLKNVSLIIFDECHRAVGDYAYPFIAEKYIQAAKTPQILGLTASPGSTEEKINEIRQNLYIDHVEIRTEKDRDVKPYVHNVDNTWIKIKLPEEFLQVKSTLEEKLKTIYKWLKSNELLNSYDINNVTRKDLLNLNKVINGRIRSPRDENEKFQMFFAKKQQANAIRLSHMLELIETQGINALNDYLDKNYEKIKKNTANKSLKELFSDHEFKQVIQTTKKIQKEGIIHPKIEYLRKILHEQISGNEDSRILVFCHFRDSVNNIVRIFEEDEVIRAHKFVGQANKGSDKGLTQKQQIELLEEFKEGIYNTLIGTSVAEEGLDIAECDLVVFYDVVPSAIRSIQRRGRTGRKKEGKVYVLMAEGTRDEGYYWAEKAKEKRMRASLNKMKSSESDQQGAQSNLMNFISESGNEEGEENEIEREKSEEMGKDRKEVKIQGANQVEIICDTRETAGAVVRNLSLMGVNVRLEQLEVGDYIISDRAAIERKAADDFNDSIKDGRLFDELINLKDNFERAILLLEGDPLLESNINQNALYGAITSIILNLGITVYKTENAKETAIFLYHLAKKEQSESTGEIKLRFKKKPHDISHLLEYLIAGVPGVNSMRARSLLTHMETLQEIFNSDIPDLLKVENIGKKIAQEIYKISRFKYDPK